MKKQSTLIQTCLTLKRAICIVLFLLLGGSASYQAIAQCGGNTQSGSNCGRSSQNLSGTIAATSGTTNVAISNYSPGTYFVMSLLQNGCYTVSTCGAPFDTQIGCFQGTTVSSPFAWNDDNGPECSGNNASVNVIPNFTGDAGIDVKQYNCLPGGSSSITVYIRQNNNIVFNTPTSVSSGQTVTLSATPASIGSGSGSYGSEGVFSGTGVTGNQFVAPWVNVPTSYNVTYTFGYVSTTQTILVNPLPNTQSGSPCVFTCPYYNGTYSANGGTSFVNIPVGIGTAFGLYVIPNASYTVSTCGSGLNTQLTVVSSVGYNCGTTNGSIAWDDDNGPLCSSTEASVNFVPNFTGFAYPQLNLSGCQTSNSTSSVIVGVRQNNNIEFNLPSSVCSGQTITLSATPASIGSGSGSAGNLGTFSGPGVIGNQFVAPVVSIPTSYNLTYTYGYVSSTQTITVKPLPVITPVANPSSICYGNAASLSFTANYGGNLTTVFTEGFANNNQGWTLGPEWQIGSATASTGGAGNPDPSVDHTPTADNGVAGVVIGGNASTALHSTYYITSPVINLTSLTTANLEFWRWLNSDYTPFMQNFVDVYDGSTWVNIWQSGASPSIFDASWTLQSFNITPYINANFQVRFGHLVGSSGVFTVSSWNIDDISISGLNTTNGYASSLWSGPASIANPASISTSVIPGSTGLLNYSVSVTDINGCSSSASTNLMVNALPTPSIIGSLSFCAGSSTTLDAGSYSNYLWSTSETTQTISVNTAGTFTVTVTDGNGCTGTASVTTTVNALPTPSISGALTFCAGSSSTLDAGTYASYLWSTSETTQTISVNTAGTFTVTVTDGNGCTGSTSVTTTVNALPTPSISGTLAFCAGSSTTLDAGSFASYLWSTSETTQTISVNTAGTFTVTVTDGNGCTGTASVTTTVNALPTPSISGALTFCAGSSSTLDAGTNASYLWSTSETTQTISVNAAGTFTVTVTDGNGCTGSASVTTTVNALPTPSISGTLAFCAGSSTTLDAGTFAIYLWSTSETTQTISVNAAGTFTVTVTDGNGCTGSTSVTTTVNTLSAPSIAGILSFCQGSATTLDAGAGYSNYNWSTGATTQSISVNTTGTFTVTVNNANGCTVSSSATTTVNANPTPIITGISLPCNGNAAILGVGVYSSYLWSTGATTQTITLTTSGTYTVTVTNANGCSGSGSYTVSVAGNAPAKPASMAGSFTANCNLLNMVYTCTPVVNATSYFWTVPVGVKIISGQGSTSITVNYTPAFNNKGVISVAAVNACGMSNALKRITTARLSSPVISGPNYMCTGDIKTYTVAAVPGALSYTWTKVTGSTILSGQGTATVNILWGNIGGLIKCSANNACGGSVNGTYSVSKVCSSKLAGSGIDFTEISLYPNPASTSATLQFDALTEGKGLVMVYDIVGQQVLSKPINVLSGDNQFVLDLNAFPKGIYNVRVDYNGMVRNQKLVVQ